MHHARGRLYEEYEVSTPYINSNAKEMDRPKDDLSTDRPKKKPGKGAPYGRAPFKFVQSQAGDFQLKELGPRTLNKIKELI